MQLIPSISFKHKMYPVVQESTEVSSADPKKKPSRSSCVSHSRESSTGQNGSGGGSRKSSVPNHHDISGPPINTRIRKQLKHVQKRYAIREEEVDFENTKLLGHGSFCEVCEVSMNGQRLAMKSLSNATMAHESQKYIVGAATDLASEAALLAMTKHENIVRLHGISVRDSLQDEQDSPMVGFNDKARGFFILLDRLETTLYQKIKDWKREQWTSKPPSWRLRRNFQHRLGLLMERLEVALALAKGVQYLHAKNIVHCDIKPKNIGFDENGVLKLFDFGVAMRLRHDNDSMRGSAGTPAYMAPEIHLDLPYGKKVDVYAFAITLWQLCALEDKLPMYDVRFLSAEDLDSALIDGVATFDDRPHVPQWWPKQLRDLMEQCWSERPDDRPSFDEIVDTMERFSEERRREKVKQYTQ
mmetsp:Transcript_13782/g.32060  ORF Transcript_13782/g.32060 Transcript_13782/m.32060 type:complete len:414 (+) Transcript_13782:87-1328(+)